MDRKSFLRNFQKQKRSAFIGVRVTPEQKEQMQQNAQKVGQNLSGYLVGLDRYADKEVLNVE